MSNQLRIFSGFMLAWYGIARWILLDKSNDTSQSWLENPLGTFVALISIVYFVYFLIFKTRKNSYPFVFFSIATGLLWVTNCYFLFIMAIEFVKVFSPINFGYLMLDIAILSYYSLMIVYCYMTNDNTNAESNALFSLV
jgi:divalent metal cation (Fe/Co/Zn/Cd) transporter